MYFYIDEEQYSRIVDRLKVENNKIPVKNIWAMNTFLPYAQLFWQKIYY